MDGVAVQANGPAPRVEQPMMVRMVVVLPAPFRPSSTVTASTPDAQGHALEDVVLADVGVDVLDLEQVSAAMRRASEVGRLHLGIAADRLGRCRRR